MNKIIIAILGILIVVAGIFAFTRPKATPIEPEPSGMASSTQVYVNTKYNITFSYPAAYVITEAERGDATRGHYSIVLVRASDSQIPENGEGPTSIIFDIYENKLGKQSLVGWLTDSAVSNYQLSQGTYASTTVAQSEAITYHWSGLYEGDTTAFVSGDTIVAVSVTYTSSEDMNRAVYNDILRSIKFEGVELM